jgi:acyl carrier protein
MTQIKSETKPAPAALLVGAETPEGQSVALSLGRAGYRVCLLALPVGSGSGLEPSAIPGHERLRHELVRAEGLDGDSLVRAAKRAEELLGHVTAYVQIALPGIGSEPRGLAPDGIDPAAFSAQLAQVGTFLSLGLALLPGMFGTQTGVFCLLTASGSALPGSALSDKAGAGAVGSMALFGALLGAVRELSERTAGTPLRSIALVTDGPRAALAPPALAVLNAQLGEAAGANALESGWFASLSSPALKGPIDFMRPASAPVIAAAPAAAPRPAAARAPGKDRVAVQLAQTFRAAFGLAPNQDVSNLAVADVKRWDSLGHLKLMMEVEQSLRVRLPADALSRIQSFKDLEKAVRANLPAR